MIDRIVRARLPFVLLFVSCFCITRGVFAQTTRYVVHLTRPQTQMVDVEMTLRALQGSTLDIAMPVWRPGRYTMLNPAATVRNVEAFDAASDRPLHIAKVRKSVWRVTTEGAKAVRVRYSFYANELNRRTRHVDDTHAFLSGESVFMYAVDRINNPCIVRIDKPDDWHIATGLEFAEGAHDTLVAPDYHVLIDSPIEVGKHARIDFDVEDVPHEIIIWGDVEFDEDQLVDDFTSIIEVQKKMWGRFPYARYVFLVHAGKGAGGGTEHLNSTIMQTSREAIEGSMENDDSYKRFLGLVSHEFFHTWNVKALRPASLVPYDYQTENYTTLLWVAEGTTSYYDDLTLVRAGINKPNKYLKTLGEAIDRYRTLPGRNVQSVEDASFNAWIQFGSSTPDDVNSRVSFYSVGALATLVLDMNIRAQTDHREHFDNVLRMLWEHFPLEKGGYTRDDLIEIVESLSQSEFRSFFETHISGVEEFDFDSALAEVGLEVYFDPAREDDEDSEAADDDAEQDDGAESTEDVPADDESEPVIPYKADLGVSLSGNTIRSVRSDGPAFGAGLLPGDELLAINTRRIHTSSDLNSVLKTFESGERVQVTYFRRDELRTIDIELGAKADGAWKVRRVEDPTEAQKEAYTSWLWKDWPRDKNDEPEEDADEDESVDE